MMLETLKKKQVIISMFFLLIFIIFFVTDSINFIKYNGLNYDSAYNATVAANMVRYGKYMVSYPNDIIFYNIITTGPIVILPTALFYYLFGINNLTTCITALIYSVFDIILIYLILNYCFKKSKYKNILSSIITILICLSDELYIHISSHLIGESAALCFVLLTILFLLLFYNSLKNKYLFLAGGFLAVAFLTKSSMIFIVGSLFGLMFIEPIFQKVKIKQTLNFFLGFFVFFAFVELFKFIQLGGINRYLNYWSDELINMFNQSSGIDLKISIMDKFNYLKEIFGINKFIALLITVLPILLYLFNSIRKIFYSNIQGKITNTLECLNSIGVASSSLIIFFLLLGGKGLMYARRLVVNSLIIKLIAAILIIEFSYYLYYLLCNKINLNRIKLNKIFCLALVIISLTFIFPITAIKENFKSMYEKETTATSELSSMNALKNSIKNLGDDIVLYTAGWWQEPNITLSFPNLKMINIYDSPYNATNNDYFLVGSNFTNKVTKTEIETLINAKLVKVNSNDIDYNTDTGDFELYSIYKIEIKND